MKKQEILKNIKGKNDIQIITENEDMFLFKNDKGLWKVKTFMGNLFYTDEELTEEIEENWEGVIDIM